MPVLRWLFLVGAFGFLAALVVFAFIPNRPQGTAFLLFAGSTACFIAYLMAGLFAYERTEAR